MSSRIEPNRFELGFSAVRNARQISVAGSPVQSTLLKVARAVAIVAAAAFDLLRNLAYALPRAFVLGVNRFFPLAIENNQTDEPVVTPLAITDRPATPVTEEVIDDPIADITALFVEPDTGTTNATAGALILHTPTQDSDDESEFNPDTVKVLDIHKPRGLIGNLTRGMVNMDIATPVSSGVRAAGRYAYNSAVSTAQSVSQYVVRSFETHEEMADVLKYALLFAGFYGYLRFIDHMRIYPLRQY